MKQDSKPLAALLNLGSKSTERLNMVGISDDHQLRDVGVVETFLRLKSAFPRETNTVFLWALEGALTNTHWQQIPPERKKQLLETISARQAQQNILQSQ